MVAHRGQNSHSTLTEQGHYHRKMLMSDSFGFSFDKKRARFQNIVPELHLNRSDKHEVFLRISGKPGGSVVPSEHIT